jgi:hypothetical protein
MSDAQLGAITMSLSSRDVSIVPSMAVVAAVCHIVLGPIIRTSFNVPGPTVAGPLIMAPIMVAGAVTQRRGALLLTSAINGLILSLFVPIGILAFPIYLVVGLVLEVFYATLPDKLYSASCSFLASGLSNAVSILLIAAVGLGMKNMILLITVSTVGFAAGGIGGLIASGVMLRVRHMYPARVEVRPQ